MGRDFVSIPRRGGPDNADGAIRATDRQAEPIGTECQLAQRRIGRDANLGLLVRRQPSKIMPFPAALLRWAFIKRLHRFTCLSLQLPGAIGLRNGPSVLLALQRLEPRRRYVAFGL